MKNIASHKKHIEATPFLWYKDLCVLIDPSLIMRRIFLISLRIDGHGIRENRSLLAQRFKRFLLLKFYKVLNFLARKKCWKIMTYFQAGKHYVHIRSKIRHRLDIP